jgi:hypothetical protein
MDTKINLYLPKSSNGRTRGRISPEGRDMLREGFSEGHSLTELARMFNVPVGTVGSVVKGKSGEPKFRKGPIKVKISGRYSGVLRELHEKRACLLSKVSKLDDAIKAIKGL